MICAYWDGCIVLTQILKISSSWSEPMFVLSFYRFCEVSLIWVLPVRADSFDEVTEGVDICERILSTTLSSLYSLIGKLGIYI